MTALSRRVTYLERQTADDGVSWIIDGPEDLDTSEALKHLGVVPGSKDSVIYLHLFLSGATPRFVGSYNIGEGRCYAH